jgi:Tfp pilus assembly protein PilW
MNPIRSLPHLKCAGRPDIGRRGLSLVELMIALIIAALGLFAISALLVISTRDLGKSRLIVSLQTDMDIASYTIKGVLEEATQVTFPNGSGGNKVVASFPGIWAKEFYPDAATPSKLIMKDDNTNNAGRVIGTLSSISFTQVDTARVQVSITVQSGGRSIQNSFVVSLRNKGYPSS